MKQYMTIWIVALAGAIASNAAPPSTAPAKTRVEFVVAVPDAGQPPPEKIYCSLSLDGWPEGGRTLALVAPGLYAGAWDFKPGAALEYKFLHAASWAGVEKGGTGEELPNRTLSVKADGGRQVVLHAVARWADLPIEPGYAAECNQPGGVAQASQRESTLTGNIRTIERVASPQLGNQRSLHVYLPPGYDDEPARRYPVVYMHDGQNVFNARTAFIGVDSRADETAEKLIRAGQLPPVIIVAIDNTPQRMDEYTPFSDGRVGGRGDAYVDFLADTVKPLIDKTFRTQPEREHTAVVGSSLGGLISLYAVYKRPDAFGAAGVMSPTLGWADGKIVTYVRDHKLAQPVRLWIDSDIPAGHPTGLSALFSRTVDAGRQLVDVLKSQGLRPELDFHYEEIQGGQHNETAWAARFERVLPYLLGVPQPSPTSQP